MSRVITDDDSLVANSRDVGAIAAPATPPPRIAIAFRRVILLISAAYFIIDRHDVGQTIAFGGMGNSVGTGVSFEMTTR